MEKYVKSIIGIILVLLVGLTLFFIIQQTMFDRDLLVPLDNIIETTLEKRSPDNFCSPNMYLAPVSGSGDVPFKGDDCNWRGDLNLDEQVDNITITPWVPTFNTNVGAVSSTNIKIEYQILNQVSDLWEQFWDYDITLTNNNNLKPVCPLGSNGDSGFIHKRGDFNEIEYFCCENSDDVIPEANTRGADVQETKCIIPDETINLPSSSGGSPRIYYHVPRYYFNSDYIKQENNISIIEFNITVNGHQSEAGSDSSNYGFINIDWVFIEKEDEILTNTSEDNTTIQDDIADDSTREDTTQSDSSTNGTCWKSKPIIQQAFTSDDNVCFKIVNDDCSDEKLYETEQECLDFVNKDKEVDEPFTWLFYLIIGLGILIMFGIPLIIYLIVKKKIL